MLKRDWPEPDPAAPSLSALAFLYARGELAGEVLRQFEARLESEQRARDALCEAVQVAHALEGRAGPLPHPLYRTRVREELRPRRPAPGTLGSLWHWLGSRRIYRGHPACWGLAGALVAGLLLCLVGQPWLAHQASLQETVASPVEASHARPAPTPAEAPREPRVGLAEQPIAEAARIFATLHNSKHLARAVAEENRRRERAIDRRVVLGDSWHPRRLEIPVMNP